MNEWTRKLLDAPTRGNLAGDRTYLDALHRAPTGMRPFFTNSGGVLVTAARTVVPSDPLPLNRSTIALAPPGCSIDSSDTTRFDADGKVHRTWVSHGDYLLRSGDMSASWWRVTCDGTERFETMLKFKSDGSMAHLDSDPSTPARGSASAGLIRTAVSKWRISTQHLGGTTPEVLWAGPSGSGRTTVVVAGPGQDGRVLAIALTDSPDNPANVDPAVTYGERTQGRHIPTGYGTATTASTGLVAVRLPVTGSSLARLGDRILVVAPPTGTASPTRPASSSVSGGSTTGFNRVGP